MEPNANELATKTAPRMKRAFLCLLLFCAMFAVIPAAYAQAGTFDLGVGFGSAHNAASGAGFYTDSYGDLYNCLPAASGCEPTNHMSGFMMGFDGTYMLTKRFGVGAGVSFNPAKQNYVNLATEAVDGYNEDIQSRMVFYDFNGVDNLVRQKHFAVRAIGGIGGANLRFYDTYSSSSTFGNSNSSQPFSSANHFQVHGGVAVPIYLRDNFFVRPQFDFRYVPNLSDQYAHDYVFQGMVYVGYSFGRM